MHISIICVLNTANALRIAIKAETFTYCAINISKITLYFVVAPNV